MPRLFIPHFNNWFGYTCPLVIKTVKKIGLPRRLKPITAKARKQLLGTLVIELAGVTQLILLEQSYGALAAANLHRLFAKYGGFKYAKISKENEKWWREAHRAEAELMKWERRCPPLIWEGDQILEERESGSVISFAVEKKEILRLRVALRIVKKKSAAKEAALSSAQNHLAQLPAFQKELARWRWTRTADFTKGMDHLSMGAPHYLRMLDEPWWTQFTETFNGFVERTVAAPTLALREPYFLDHLGGLPAHIWDPVACRYVVQPKKLVHDWDVEAARHLNSSDYRFWSDRKKGHEWSKVNQERVSPAKLRSALRDDDAFAMKFLWSHRRPNNPYSDWLKGLSDHPEQREKWRIPLDLKWISKMEKFHPVSWDRDHVSRLNQLWWCLSVEGTAECRFKPLVQESSPELEGRLSRWYKKIAVRKKKAI